MTTKTVTLAGLSLDVAPYHVNTAEGLVGSPEIRRYELARAARHGVMAQPSLMSGRTVALSVWVNHPAEATFQAALDTLLDTVAAAFSTDATLAFDVTGNQLALTVRAVRWDVATDVMFHQGAALVSVELFAAQPLALSASETTTVIGLAVSGGGFTFPFSFPLVFSGGGSSGTATIVNSGNVSSPPRFRIDGPVTNPTIRSDTADRALTLSLTVDTGDWVDLNVQNRSVLLNGTASRYSSLTSAEWFELTPGNNTIRFSGSSAGNPTLTVYSRSAWI